MVDRIIMAYQPRPDTSCIQHKVSPMYSVGFDVAMVANIFASMPLLPVLGITVVPLLLVWNVIFDFSSFVKLPKSLGKIPSSIEAPFSSGTPCVGPVLIILWVCTC